LYGIADHIYVLVFAVIHPVLGYLSFRRLLARIARGEHFDRRSIYLQSMLAHWLLLAIGLSLWFANDRSPAGLGFTVVPGPGLIAGTVLCFLAIGFLLRQNRAAATADTATLRRYRAAFGAMRPIVPHDRRELRHFFLLSATAGVVEEVLWRGFLIAYLLAFAPPWLAAAVATLAFGLAHAYQGRAALPRVTLVGALFTLLYLMTGSLLLPVILHGMLDALQGRFAWLVNARLREAG